VADSHSSTIFHQFCRENNDVFVTASKDDGRTWSAPVNITASVKRVDWTWYATGPGVGIQIQRGRYKGRLVIPCDHREEGAKVSHVFLSDDRGKTWRLGGSAQRLTDECQLAELADASLLLNMRNYHGVDGGDKEKARKRAISRSLDGGETWPELWFDDTLIEPVCQASLIAYPAKRALLFANPASRESRVRMTVRASLDQGKTWPAAKIIYEGPSAYSCLAVLRGGNIGLLYERGTKNAYEKITFARFSFYWLMK